MDKFVINNCLSNACEFKHMRNIQTVGGTMVIMSLFSSRTLSVHISSSKSACIYNVILLKDFNRIYNTYSFKHIHTEIDNLRYKFI